MNWMYSFVCTLISFPRTLFSKQKETIAIVAQNSKGNKSWKKIAKAIRPTTDKNNNNTNFAVIDGEVIQVTIYISVYDVCIQQ